MGGGVDLKKVQAYMVLNGWSMRQLAEQMGVNHATVSRVFAGSRSPGGAFIRGLLKIGMNASDIFLPVAVPKNSKKGA